MTALCAQAKGKRQKVKVLRHFGPLAPGTAAAISATNRGAAAFTFAFYLLPFASTAECAP